MRRADWVGKRCGRERTQASCSCQEIALPPSTRAQALPGGAHNRRRSTLFLSPRWPEPWGLTGWGWVDARVTRSLAGSADSGAAKEHWSRAHPTLGDISLPLNTHMNKKAARYSLPDAAAPATSAAGGARAVATSPSSLVTSPSHPVLPPHPHTLPPRHALLFGLVARRAQAL